MALEKYWVHHQESHNWTTAFTGAWHLFNTTPTYPGGAGDHHLRSIWWPRLKVQVDPSNPPATEAWWYNCEIGFVAWFEEGSTPVVPNPFAVPDERIVVSGSLTPNKWDDPNFPGAYCVRFEPPAGGFQTKGMRAPHLPSAYGSKMCAAVYNGDLTASITGGGLYSTVVYSSVFSSVLWGTLPL